MKFPWQTSRNAKKTLDNVSEEDVRLARGTLAHAVVKLERVEHDLDELIRRVNAELDKGTAR